MYLVSKCSWINEDEIHTDNDKITFISYNRPLSFQHLWNGTAQKQKHQNKATETPPLPLLRADKSISVNLTVSRDLQIKQSEGITNKWFTP